MKIRIKLNKTAFGLLLSGLIVVIAFCFINILLNTYTLRSIDVPIIRFGRIAEYVTLLSGFTAVGGTIYFLVRTSSNHKNPQGQTYINVLFILSIIYCAGAILGMFENKHNFIGIVGFGLVIAGTAVQKSFVKKYSKVDSKNFDSTEKE